MSAMNFATPPQSDWRRALEIAVTCVLGDIHATIAADQIDELTPVNAPVPNVAFAFADDILHGRLKLREGGVVTVTLITALVGPAGLREENWSPVVNTLIELGLQVTKTGRATWIIRANT